MLQKRHSRKDASKKTLWKRRFKKDTLENMLQKNAPNLPPPQKISTLSQNLYEFSVKNKIIWHLYIFHFLTIFFLFVACFLIRMTQSQKRKIEI
jgi:hypothetical protein